MKSGDIQTVFFRLWALSLILLLTSCATLGKTRQIAIIGDFQEPSASSETARLRIISNGTVGGRAYDGCAKGADKLVSAGKFKHGRYNLAHPPSPWPEKTLGMRARVAPSLAQYSTGRKMAEGLYGEVIAEYNVSTDRPLLLVSKGIYAAGSTFSYTCPAAHGVFKLEAQKEYELVAGIAHHPNDSKQLVCMFSLYQLKNSIEFIMTGASRPLPFTTPDIAPCSAPPDNNTPSQVVEQSETELNTGSEH